MRSFVIVKNTIYLQHHFVELCDESMDIKECIFDKCIHFVEGSTQAIDMHHSGIFIRRLRHILRDIFD